MHAELFDDCLSPPHNWKELRALGMSYLFHTFSTAWAQQPKHGSCTSIGSCC